MLSRPVYVIRGSFLIINLTGGSPKAVKKRCPP
jgi:molybdopterin biosynthesis enzyme MoaB